MNPEAPQNLLFLNLFYIFFITPENKNLSLNTYLKTANQFDSKMFLDKIKGSEFEKFYPLLERS